MNDNEIISWLIGKDIKKYESFADYMGWAYPRRFSLSTGGITFTELAHSHGMPIIVCDSCTHDLHPFERFLGATYIVIGKRGKRVHLLAKLGISEPVTYEITGKKNVVTFLKKIRWSLDEYPLTIVDLWETIIKTIGNG